MDAVDAWFVGTEETDDVAGAVVVDPKDDFVVCRFPN